VSRWGQHARAVRWRQHARAVRTEKLGLPRGGRRLPAAGRGRQEPLAAQRKAATLTHQEVATCAQPPFKTTPGCRHEPRLAAPTREQRDVALHPHRQHLGHVLGVAAPPLHLDLRGACRPRRHGSRQQAAG
jgi:hypothetical protein